MNILDEFGCQQVENVKSMLDANQRIIDLIDEVFEREYRIIEQKIRAKKDYDGLGVA